jgi:transposase-like protein
MGTKGKERRVYSKEFKAEAVTPAGKCEKPVRRVAVDLGVNENMPYRWIRQSREAGGTDRAPFPGHGRPQDEEPTRLGGGVKLRFTRNPKKRGGHLRTGETLVIVYRFMSENRREYTIRESGGRKEADRSRWNRFVGYRRSTTIGMGALGRGKR